MTLIHRLGLICAIVGMWSAPVRAQERDIFDPERNKPLPSAESLFEAHIERIGGREKVFAQKSRRLAGELVIRQAKIRGFIEMIQEAPDKLYIMRENPGVGTQKIWFDGEEGWKYDSLGGAFQVLGDELEDLTQTADFYGLANYKENYATIETVERNVFEGRRVYKVKASRDEQTFEWVFFDMESRLVIGIDSLVQTPDGPVLLHNIIADYKDASGVLYPMTFVQHIDSKPPTTTEMRFKTIEIDVEQDVEFAPSEEIKKDARERERHRQD